VRRLRIKRDIYGIVLLTAIATSGCNFPHLQFGHYEGELVVGGELKSFEVNDPLKNVVSFELKKERKSILLEVSSSSQSKLFDVRITRKNRGSFIIEVPNLEPILFHPKKYASSSDSGGMNCYGDFSHYKISLCANYNEFKLNVSDSSHKTILAIVGGKFSQNSNFTLEESQVFKLSEAVEQALKKNFGSRIEYRKMIYAKEKAKAAYLSLLPNINIAAVLSVASFAVSQNAFALLNCMNNFTPFLFPGRWILAKASVYQARAVQDSYRIMQANLGSQVETLSYNLLAHRAQLKIYDDLIEEAKSILSKVISLELLNKMQPGSVKTMKTLVTELEFGRAIVDNNINIDRQALSMSLGFLNPDAVKDILFDKNEVSLKDLKPLNAIEIGKLARDRSMEARQFGLLAEAAQKEKAELLFHWMDPAGGSSSPLGFNLIPQVKAIKQQIENLLDQQEQRKQEAFYYGYVDGHTYNNMIRATQKARQYKEDQASRMKDLLNRLTVASSDSSEQEPLNVKSYEIQGIFHDYLAASLLTEGYTALFLSARTRIERHLLIGYFSRLDSSFESVSLEAFEETDVSVISKQNLYQALNAVQPDEKLTDYINLLNYFK
jgi:hypothetical protein